MLRKCLPFLLVASLAAALPLAEAQRQGAPISQGVTSGELAVTADQLRIANAEMGAKFTGLESDMAKLNGELETLEFLLSQSRNQINDMQEDDAEIARLIGRLEAKIDQQEQVIAALSQRVQALEGSAAGGPAATLGALPEAGVVAPFSDQADMASIASAPTDLGAGSGPRSIVPAQAAGPQNVDTQPASSGLPQGSLGTLPASALPGEAGPLFAEAKSRLLRFDYAGAEAAFRSFLTQFGDDPQAGEAQYWLAEALYQQETYVASGQAYSKMIRDYPDDPRAPEALAKLARSMRLIGDLDKACNALNLLPRQYPNASGVTKNLAAGERVRAGCDS